MDYKYSWKELIVTDSDNFKDTLGNVIKNNPELLNNATIYQGKIRDWPEYFISAPNEEPDWDTPKEEINWEGFNPIIK